MPMGIVSDEEFDKELNNTEIKTPDIIPMPTAGRNPGDNNVPDSLRRIIGETSQVEGRKEALHLAKSFGISPSSVSAYDAGAHSTTSMDVQPNLSHINQAKERISKKARSRLFKALHHITDEKLADAKAVDLASIAKNMSGIVKEMEPETPKDQGDSKKGPTFIIYSPTVRQENYYDTVVARE